MLQVYVFTAGATTREVFNAVSAFMNTDDFSKAIGIAAMCSVLGCVIQCLMSHDLRIFFKWFLVYFCVTTILIGVKTSVQIVDLTNPMATYFVDNVPYGIAMPASIITSVEAGLTQGIEDVFHTPSDVSYAQTGMLFGAQLFNAVNNGSIILNDSTKNDFNHFVRQCIVPDILINHKYTFEQLINAPDILNFLSEQPMSPLRGIYINGKFDTCATALPIITQEIESNVNDQTSMISHFLWGDQVISGGDLFSKIQNVYSYMMVMTDDASNIIYQNTMINAIRDGIGTQIAKNDSAAAMLNYSYTSAMQKQLLADNTLARVASYMLPLSQTVFVLLMIGIFPIIALLSLQPLLFVKTLKTYIGSLVYLATWPILFCIINFIMTTELSFHMSSITQLQGGITLSNQNQLLYIAEQFAAYCGYLIALVPVIAGFIFRGLDSVFMNAAQTLMGNMQSWTSQSATAMTEGNVSLANSSIGNHSWNNWSANKHDSNYTNFSGMQTNQLDNAVTITTTPTGESIYNTTGAISNLATSVNTGQMISNQLSKNYDHSLQLAKQQGISYSHSVTQSWNDLVSFSRSHGITANTGESYAVGRQTSTTQAACNILGVVQDVAKNNRISEHEAYQHLQGNGFATSVEAGASLGIPFVKIAGSVGAKASFSANYSHSNSYGTSDDQSQMVNISSNEQRQFSENYNLIKNASNTMHTDSSRNSSDSQLSQLSSDFRNTDSIASQLSNTLSQTERYSKMISYAKSNSSNIANNFGQSLTDYIEKENPSKAREILSNTNNVAITEERLALAESFIKNNYMKQFEQSFDGSTNMQESYNNSSRNYSNQSDRVVSNFMEQKNDIKTISNSYGISSPGSENIAQMATDDFSNMQQAIQNAHSSIQTQNHNLTGNTQKKISTGQNFIKNKR